MMTFGLNRPVYSYGLIVVTSFFPHGDLRCAVELEDLRVMDALTPEALEAEDLRVDQIFDYREIKILENRVVLETRTHLSKVIDVRMFEVEAERVFIDEEDTRTFIVELECDEDDV